MRALIFDGKIILLSALDGMNISPRWNKPRWNGTGLMTTESPWKFFTSRAKSFAGEGLRFLRRGNDNADFIAAWYFKAAASYALDIGIGRTVGDP